MRWLALTRLPVTPCYSSATHPLALRSPLVHDCVTFWSGAQLHMAALHACMLSQCLSACKSRSAFGISQRQLCLGKLQSHLKKSSTAWGKTHSTVNKHCWHLNPQAAPMYPVARRHFHYWICNGNLPPIKHRPTSLPATRHSQQEPEPTIFASLIQEVVHGVIDRQSRRHPAVTCSYTAPPWPQP